jgi:signal transduction histidine kinase
MSIRTRIILFALILLSAVSFAFLVTNYHSEKEIVQNAEVKKQVQIAQAWAQVCRETWASSRKQEAINYFNQSFKTNSFVTDCICVAENGIVYSASDNDLVGTKLNKKLVAEYLDLNKTAFWKVKTDNYPDGVITYSIPMALSSKNIVVARTNFSGPEIMKHIASNLGLIRNRIYGASIVAFLIGCAGILLIANVLVKPIKDLIDGTRKIAQGDLKHRIPVKSKDEMGHLASEFNSMAQKLSELHEMKRDFSLGITHDLRSPVTGIKLSIDNISDQLKEEEYSRIPEQIFLINENIDRLNVYIDSLLDISHIESGKMKLDIRSVNLEDIADRIIKHFQSYAAQKKIDLNLIVESEIPDIKADSSKLEQAFTNLIGNALKYTNKGNVSVFIKANTGVQTVKIADTGVGIKKSEQDKIFERFYKGDSLDKGSGLGLFIAKSIVELHGGTIECDSEERKGTTFTVKMPQWPKSA